MLISRHTGTTYPKFIHSCKVIIHEETWERVDTGLSEMNTRRVGHQHGFMKVGPHQYYAEAMARRDFGSGKVKVQYLHGGVRSLTVLKTTKSGFANFVRDQYTHSLNATNGCWRLQSMQHGSTTEQPSKLPKTTTR